MSKRTNKVVHSDTSKEENEISLDTVLEHSVNSRDENMMAMEDKTSNPNRKQRKARKKAKHLSQRWQSMPSRTIDDMVGKLSNKDDETLTKRSFDRTDEEDFSLSDVEDVKKQSMPSRTINEMVGKLSVEDNETLSEQSFDRTVEEWSHSDVEEEHVGKITDDLHKLSVSETINERVRRLAKGKPGFVNKAGKATGQPHSNVREEDEDFGKMSSENDKNDLQKLTVSETINERVRRLAKGKPGFVNKAGKATRQPHSNVREEDEDFGKESRPSKEIAKQVRKKPRRDRSPLNSPETLPKEKQILERINEGDLTGEENDEEKEIKRVSKPSEIIKETAGKLSKRRRQSPFAVKTGQSQETVDELDWEDCVGEGGKRSIPSKVIAKRAGKLSRLYRRFANKFGGFTERAQPRKSAHKRNMPSSDDDDDGDTEQAREDKNTDETQVINEIFIDSSEEMVLKTFHQLIHMGEDLNYLCKDKLGRSILHKAVDNNFLSVVEKLLDYDFDPLCYDNNYHMPLHIAITKGYDEMAALIVSKLDNFVVRRLFGDNESKANKFRGKSSVYKRTLLSTGTDLSKFKTFNENTVKPMFTINELIEYNLDQTLMQVLDSFLEEQRNGSYNVHIKLLDIDDNKQEPTHEDFDFKCYTTFHTLATCDKKDALNHPAVRTYVEHKWRNWCQARFLRYFFLYLLSLFCWTYSAVTGVSAPDVHTYDTRLQHSRAFFEVIAYLFALGILFMEILQILRHRWYYFSQAFNILELTSAALLVMVLPLRYINVTVHWYFYAIGYCLWGMKIFKYSIVFNETGIYAEVIKRIIVQDFVQFSILFAVVNLIFSGTFILILKADDNLNAHAETSSFQGTMYVGLRTLIEAAAIVEYSGTDGYRTAGTILMLVYMFFTIVALLNILIAQVSETYTRTHGDCVKTVRANRAWTIARAERNEWHILPCRQPRRVKHYLGVIKHIDLDAIKKKESTFIEEISEKIVKIEKKQIKDGLEVHTVKTRLGESTQRIEGKIDDLSEQLKKVLDLLKERNK